MCNPLSSLPQSNSEPLRLYEGAVPVKRFDLCSESLGTLLVRNTNLMVVPGETVPILRALDTNATLRQLERQFGESGIALIGQLYQRGLVDLVW
jgi:hypothetical protein